MYDSRRHLRYLQTTGERTGAPPGGRRPFRLSILLFPGFLAAALASERFFDALLFAGLQVKGVALDLLDDVFLLHLTLKAAQCILKGLALLQSDLSQLDYTPKLVPFGLDKLLQGSESKSSENVKELAQLWRCGNVGMLRFDMLD